MTRKNFTQKAGESVAVEDFHELLNYSPVPMWIFHADTLKFLYVNNAAVYHYGYSRDQFLNMSLFDIRPADEISLTQEAVDKSRLNDLYSTSQIFTHIKKDGGRIRVRIETKAVDTVFGKGHLVLITDVTAREAYEKKLSELNERLSAAQKIGKVGYWTNDLAKQKIEWSDELLEIFELDHSFELTLPNIISRFHPDDRGQIKTDMGDVFTGGQVTESERRIITPSGKVKWIQERIKLTRSNDGTPLLLEGSAAEITRYKELEDAITKKSILLHALNKFTSRLLKLDDWRSAFSALLEEVAPIISLHRIFYFVSGFNVDKGEQYVSLRLKWSVNPKEFSQQYPHLEGVRVSKVPEFFDTVAAGHIYEGITSQMPEGYFRDSLTRFNVKSFLIIPVMHANEMHGYLSLHDCEKERKWDQDELLFFDAVVANLTTFFEKRDGADELKKKAEELKQSNERYDLVLRATGEALIDWDIENDKTTWGIGFQLLFGYDLSVHNEHLWSDNIHPDDKERVLYKLEQTLTDPSQVSYFDEFRFLKANREVAFIQHKGIFIRNAEGKAVRSVGAIADITTSVTRMQRIEKQNAQLREIAWIQSHIVRAPLATLMGLVNILPQMETEADRDNLINDIKVVAAELDTNIKDIVRKTEEVHDELDHF